MPAHRDLAGLHDMLELAVTALLADLLPAVCFQAFDDVSNLQDSASSLRRSLHESCAICRAISRWISPLWSS